MWKKTLKFVKESKESLHIFVNADNLFITCTQLNSIFKALAFVLFLEYIYLKVAVKESYFYSSAIDIVYFLLIRIFILDEILNLFNSHYW